MWVRNRPKVRSQDRCEGPIDKYQAYECGTYVLLEKLCSEKLGSMAKRLDGTDVQKGRSVVATFELP